MNKSKTELLIESLETMNLNLMDVLLDEHNTYDEASKDVFLEKVNEVFTELKTAGNTRLHAHQGYCHSSESPNKGCKGYSFVANKTNDYFDLIIEEKNNDIHDLFGCSELALHESSVKRRR